MIEALWGFRERMTACGAVAMKRSTQQKHWMWKSLMGLTTRALTEDPLIQSQHRFLEGSNE